MKGRKERGKVGQDKGKRKRKKRRRTKRMKIGHAFSKTIYQVSMQDTCP